VICSPLSGAPKSEVVLSGAYFGTKKGKVKLGGKKAKVLSWGTGSVRIRIHKKVAVGPASLEVRTKTGTSVFPSAYTVQ